MNVVLPPKNNSADQWTGYNLVLLWLRDVLESSSKMSYQKGVVWLLLQ